ncbi:MAG TPA: GGDEF domain-containing protein, partial [Gammaproteobacteria bacterium]
DAELEYKFTRTRLAELPLTLQAGLGFLVVLYMTLAISQSIWGAASIASNLGYAVLGIAVLIFLGFLNPVRIRQGTTHMPEYLAAGILMGVVLTGLLPATHLQLHMAALLVTLLWYWLFSGFSFERASLVGWPLVAGAAVIWLFFSNRTPAGDVLLLVIALLATALFATLSAYITERRWRLSFLHQHAPSLRQPASAGAGAGLPGALIPPTRDRNGLEWAQSLKAMTVDLAAIHETDLMFVRLLEHLRKQISFDAAAVGALRNGRMMPVVMRDQLSGVNHEDSIKMLWTGELLDLLQNTRNVHRGEAELGLLESSLHGDSISFGYRLDIPYFSQRRLNGVVTLLRKRAAFTDFEVNFASSMVFHGMFAQRSARLQQRLERLSARQASPPQNPATGKTAKDNLLPVLPPEMFIERAGAEFKRLTLEGKPVSLLLIEIDQHEELAKKYGERGSREIFATVTNILQNCLKEGNLLGRYGAGSFAVQLAMPVGTAKQLAEGLRYTIEACGLKLNGHSTKVTVSIGVSCFGDSASDFLSLLRSADLSLFLARDANGNTVRVSN